MLDVTRKCSHIGSNPILTTKKKNKEWSLLLLKLIQMNGHIYGIG